ncbi:zein-binding domain-containing protein [Artemisia annua]|uniref:Zein-binding domain-containing protein n=1 Tax=Artemisia annua TaxID=35608 RepID=A0A2U1P131_ARTAN|nr:zein-binding domain-containing protein [Artemisia annua]
MSHKQHRSRLQPIQKDTKTYHRSHLKPKPKLLQIRDDYMQRCDLKPIPSNAVNYGILLLLQLIVGALLPCIKVLVLNSVEETDAATRTPSNPTHIRSLKIKISRLLCFGFFPLIDSHYIMFKVVATTTGDNHIVMQASRWKLQGGFKHDDFVAEMNDLKQATLTTKDNHEVSHLRESVADGHFLTDTIYAVGHISGAHMNPTVTLAMLVILKRVKFLLSNKGVRHSVSTTRVRMGPVLETSRTAAFENYGFWQVYPPSMGTELQCGLEHKDFLSIIEFSRVIYIKVLPEVRQWSQAMLVTSKRVKFLLSIFHTICESTIGNSNRGVRHSVSTTRVRMGPVLATSRTACSASASENSTKIPVSKLCKNLLISVYGKEQVHEWRRIVMMRRSQKLKLSEQATRAALYVEFEKERTAAATAADEAMSMILRLQEEKASIEMELCQYQQMIEEKSAYDEEEMNILKEIVLRREREKHFLEKEVEAYRQMTHHENDQFYRGDNQDSNEDHDLTKMQDYMKMLSLTRREMEADVATDSRVYDVHIDHGPKSSEKLNEAKKQSDQNQSASDCSGGLPPVSSNSSSLRRNSTSALDNERTKLDTEVDWLRERFRVMQEGREKLNFSIDNREKESLQLQLLEDIACQLQEIRMLTEPKIARHAYLSLPSSKVIKDVLGDKMEKVIVSDCVVDSPCCLVTVEYGIKQYQAVKHPNSVLSSRYVRARSENKLHNYVERMKLVTNHCSTLRCSGLGFLTLCLKDLRKHVFSVTTGGQVRENDIVSKFRYVTQGGVIKDPQMNEVAPNFRRILTSRLRRLVQQNKLEKVILLCFCVTLNGRKACCDTLELLNELFNYTRAFIRSVLGKRLGKSMRVVTEAVKAMSKEDVWSFEEAWEITIAGHGLKWTDI